MPKAVILALLKRVASIDLPEILVEVEKGIFKSDLSKLQTEIQETRYSSGQYKCPFCHDDHIVKNGKAKGNQRYLCRNCGKSFSQQTQTPTAYSKKETKVWIDYIECMIKGYSLRRCAWECNINLATAFFWRHKILDALSSFMGTGEVDGLVEADECYLRYSYKGNHSKSKRFTMPRPARKRGGESVGKRGLSSEQVCVGTALDRTGNILIGMIGTGRAKYHNLKRFFEGHIAPHSILCTDSAHGYGKLAKQLELEHKAIPSGKHMKGIYHIQHINAFHSNFKTFLQKFRGVSTKHLNSYLKWFKWIELFKNEKELLKIQKAYIQSQATYAGNLIEEILSRKPMFV